MRKVPPTGFISKGKIITWDAWVVLTYAEKTKSALQPLRLSHHWCISPFRKKTRQQSQGEGQAKKKRTFLMCFLFSIIWAPVAACLDVLLLVVKESHRAPLDVKTRDWGSCRFVSSLDWICNKLKKDAERDLSVVNIWLKLKPGADSNCINNCFGTGKILQMLQGRNPRTPRCSSSHTWVITTNVATFKR